MALQDSPRGRARLIIEPPPPLVGSLVIKARIAGDQKRFYLNEGTSLATLKDELNKRFYVSPRDAIQIADSAGNLSSLSTEHEWQTLVKDNEGEVQLVVTQSETMRRPSTTNTGTTGTTTHPIIGEQRRPSDTLVHGHVMGQGSSQGAQGQEDMTRVSLHTPIAHQPQEAQETAAETMGIGRPLPTPPASMDTSGSSVQDIKKRFDAPPARPAGGPPKQEQGFKTLDQVQPVKPPTDVPPPPYGRRPSRPPLPDVLLLFSSSSSPHSFLLQQTEPLNARLRRSASEETGGMPEAIMPPPPIEASFAPEEATEKGAASLDRPTGMPASFGLLAQMGLAEHQERPPPVVAEMLPEPVDTPTPTGSSEQQMLPQSMQKGKEELPPPGHTAPIYDGKIVAGDVAEAPPLPSQTPPSVPPMDAHTASTAAATTKAQPAPMPMQQQQQMKEQAAKDAESGFIWQYGDPAIGESMTYQGDTDHKGRRHGMGMLRWPNGAEYNGHWRKGLQHGQGKMTWVDGSIYEGSWKRGTKSGQGKMTWPDGSTYEGRFKHGIMNGKGIRTDRGSGLVEAGEWKDGRFVRGAEVELKH